ncbi:hypothetical protein LY76DRAFT_256591 [Colletotrichum caudatum]|nr:hypothetical protein LY76DRAFT_256591 [Colletotrichum caudatum]
MQPVTKISWPPRALGSTAKAAAEEEKSGNAGSDDQSGREPFRTRSSTTILRRGRRLGRPHCDGSPSRPPLRHTHTHTHTHTLSLSLSLDAAMRRKILFCLEENRPPCAMTHVTASENQYGYECHCRRC